MLSMRVRVLKLATGWLAVAVLTSSGTTCIPGAMRVHAGRRQEMQVPACAAMAIDGPAISGDLATDCCARHEPSVTVAKTDVRTAPHQHVSQLAAWLAPPVLASAMRAHGAEGPPGTLTLGPSVYITLSTLRI